MNILFLGAEPTFWTLINYSANMCWTSYEPTVYSIYRIRQYQALHIFWVCGTSKEVLLTTLLCKQLGIGLYDREYFSYNVLQKEKCYRDF